MPLVFDEPQRVATWVAACSGSDAPMVDAAIGYEDEYGRLTAGVYFDAMNENNIFAHIASVARVLPRSLLQAVTIYVVCQLKHERVTFAVSDANTQAKTLVEAMGAKQEARLSRACGNHDLLLYVLWANDPFPQRLLKRKV